MSKPKPTATDERREQLRGYIMKCIQQNLLSLEDLQNPLALMSKFGSTMLADLKIVGADLLQGAGAVGAMKAAEGFMQLASTLSDRRRR